MAMDLIRVDIREVITDILTIKYSVDSLPPKERDQIWDYIFQEISKLDKYTTPEELVTIHNIFQRIKNE
jgi:hypothetical protein